MTGRGWAPALLEIFPIQTWRGQDLNDGQGLAPALLEIFPIQTWRSQDLNDGQGPGPCYPQRLLHL
jgi:hypothetical protein